MVKGASVAYCVTGGIVLYSGIKGATIADTVKAVLHGNLSVQTTQGITAPSDSASVQTGTSGITSGGGNAAQNKALAKQIAISMGLQSWTTGQEWQDLDSLWTRESGWETDAKNASSGAYGIPQALPGSKMASAGSDWQTNPATQIKWGFGYIRDRYGSPAMAWAHEQANGWY